MIPQKRRNRQRGQLSANIFRELWGAVAMLMVLIVIGTADMTTFAQRDAYRIYEEIGSTEKSLVVLENAGHNVYVDNCPDMIEMFPDLYGMCSDDVWDLDRAHDLINHFTAAALRSQFYDDPAAADALADGAAAFTGVSMISTP